MTRAQQEECGNPVSHENCMRNTVTEISQNILWSGQFEDKHQLGGVFHSLLPPALYQCHLERTITCLHYILVLLVLTVNNKLT